MPTACGVHACLCINCVCVCVCMCVCVCERQTDRQCVVCVCVCIHVCVCEREREFSLCSYVCGHVKFNMLPLAVFCFCKLLVYLGMSETRCS